MNALARTTLDLVNALLGKERPKQIVRVCGTSLHSGFVRYLAAVSREGRPETTELYNVDTIDLEALREGADPKEIGLEPVDGFENDEDAEDRGHRQVMAEFRRARIER